MNIDALNLFPTSKVRLHCDYSTFRLAGTATGPFPDLKGQAPLRLLTTSS